MSQVYNQPIIMKNKDLVSGLETEGFIYVPYPFALRASIENAVEAWKRFCALPERKRMEFPYDPGKGMGVGYELKKTPGSHRDLKEDFHFTSGKREWLAHAAEGFGSHEASEFVAAANSLLNDMSPFIMDVFMQVERQFGIKGLTQEAANSQGSWFLRFLHYFGNRTPGDEIATSHADKCGLTFHLHESAIGLQYMDHSKEWKSAPVPAGTSMIIPGMRIQYRSKGRLKATYHRVVASPSAAQKGRFSVVCFVHLDRTPQYDKKHAGRLQEFPPGFNYDMPFKEFSKLFIKPD